jgi:integrase
MLKWVQVDFEEECFTIPETKNGQPHTLPMSSFLKDLLIGRHKECGTSPYVFPGTGKAGHLNDPKKGITRVREITGIKFSCHDLRRTFATIAESLDMSSYTIKALLNHKQQAGDVTGGYIILSVDRLRGPMQKVTDAILERINRRFGQVNYLSARI